MPAPRILLCLINHRGGATLLIPMTKAVLMMLAHRFVMILAALILTGCGHKGPLIVPDPNAVEPNRHNSQQKSAAQSTFELPANF